MIGQDNVTDFEQIGRINAEFRKFLLWLNFSLRELTAIGLG